MNEDYQDLPPAVKEELSRAMDAMEPEMDVEEIRAILEASKDGCAKNNRHNCKMILQHDPLLKGAFRYNIFAEQTDVVKPLWRRKSSPAFNDMDMNYLMLYLEACLN